MGLIFLLYYIIETMAYANQIALAFRKFRHALGWFLIELLGLSSSALFISLLLWTLYNIYATMTNSDPNKIFKISKKEQKFTVQIELIVLALLFAFLVGLMFGIIYIRVM